MTPFLQLIIALALLIAAAKLGGYLSIRIGQPAVLGELVVGIILGPSLLNVLDLPYFTDPHLEEVITLMAEIGVLLLMFLAGLDLHIKDLLSSAKVSSLAGTMGVILPLSLGTLTGILFGMDLQSAIFIGLILSATSVSISAQTLMELKALRSRMGVGLLGAAVFDDILVLLSLSIFTALIQPETDSGLASILLIVLKIVLFLGVGSAIGMWIFPKLGQWVNRLPISQGLISITFVVILLYGWSAEMIGQIAAIIGAFLAGLWFGRTPQKERIHNGISSIAYVIFVPLFFINIGLSVDARTLTLESELLMLVLVIVAVVSKVLGCGFGALVGGFSRRESLQLGVGMVSRGEVGLIEAAIGLEMGLITENILSAVVGVIIITTLLTPVLLRALFPKGRSSTEGVEVTSRGDG